MHLAEPSLLDDNASTSLSKQLCLVVMIVDGCVSFIISQCWGSILFQSVELRPFSTLSVLGELGLSPGEVHAYFFPQVNILNFSSARVGISFLLPIISYTLCPSGGGTSNSCHSPGFFSVSLMRREGSFWNAICLCQSWLSCCHPSYYKS